jgi:hypothetical protein
LTGRLRLVLSRRTIEAEPIVPNGAFDREAAKADVVVKP